MFDLVPSFHLRWRRDHVPIALHAKAPGSAGHIFQDENATIRTVLATIFGICAFGYAQSTMADQLTAANIAPADRAAVVARVKSQMNLKYPGSSIVLAKTTPDGTDVLEAGTVLTLQKDNLVFNKVFLPGSNSPSSPLENSYEKNAIIQVGLLGSLSKLDGLLKALGQPASESMNRTFSRGDKFWVTRISITSNYDGLVFHLLSDPIDNARFHGTLSFPFAKGNISDVDQAINAISDVLTTDSPAEARAADSAGESNKQSARLPDIPPPPRPPESSQATIAVGQTKDQVIAILGSPYKIVNLSGKETYFYPNMKVVLVKDKVVDFH